MFVSVLLVFPWNSSLSNSITSKIDRIFRQIRVNSRQTFPSATSGTPNRALFFSLALAEDARVRYVRRFSGQSTSNRMYLGYFPNSDQCVPPNTKLSRDIAIDFPCGRSLVREISTEPNFQLPRPIWPKVHCFASDERIELVIRAHSKNERLVKCVMHEYNSILILQRLSEVVWQIFITNLRPIRPKKSKY